MKVTVGKEGKEEDGKKDREMKGRKIIEGRLGACSKQGMAKRSSPYPRTPSSVGREKEGEGKKEGKGPQRTLERWLTFQQSRAEGPDKSTEETVREVALGKPKRKAESKKEGKEMKEDVT